MHAALAGIIIVAIRLRFLRLLGVVLDGEPVMIVTELMTNGALNDYLSDRRDGVSLDRLLLMIADIAAGMTYLAGKGFVHRDLAARNILVSEDLFCKVSQHPPASAVCLSLRVQRRFFVPAVVELHPFLTAIHWPTSAPCPL